MNDTLQDGNYCQVTEKQTIELLTIEKFINPKSYANAFFGEGGYQKVFIRYDEDNGLLITCLEPATNTKELPFAQFRYNLINTIK
jgi:hypothetical protein